MLKALIIAVVLVYGAAMAVMFLAQRSFLYFPDAKRTSPQSVGLVSVQERVLDTADGEKVIAWYGSAKPGQPTLLYFHGNGGSLEFRAERIRKYLALGRGVYMMSYRGYSGSTGSPSETANLADAALAYDDLRRLGVAASDIIVYGESLGTGVAVAIAGEKPCAGLILDSPYTSIVERAGQLYPWLPVGLLLKDRYDSLSRIGKVSVPLLIVHGDQDDVIPVEMGRRLFAAAHQPKELAIIKGAGHNNHWEFGSYDLINTWIDKQRVVPAAP